MSSSPAPNLRLTRQPVIFPGACAANWKTGRFPPPRFRVPLWEGVKGEPSSKTGSPSFVWVPRTTCLYGPIEEIRPEVPICTLQCHKILAAILMCPDEAVPPMVVERTLEASPMVIQDACFPREIGGCLPDLLHSAIKLDSCLLSLFPCACNRKKLREPADSPVGFSVSGSHIPLRSQAEGERRWQKSAISTCSNHRVCVHELEIMRNFVLCVIGVDRPGLPSACRGDDKAGDEAAATGDTGLKRTLNTVLSGS
ncbi:hypothetical protein RRG08_014229 [Elysia crispata]|uniref:Uncharacterized protein n=1 Tax=Elysia crispata TaxID=231223 RepID=A0AAE1CEV4_9GAST|nr:hypothetical protein RRG08_014229 [Elysia crispata]